MDVVPTYRVTVFLMCLNSHVAAIWPDRAIVGSTTGGKWAHAENHDAQQPFQFCI